MKKIINIFLCITFCVGMFTACSGKTALEEAAAKALAEKHTQLMVNGEYDAILEECSEKVKKQIDATALEAAMEQTTALAGEYESIHSVDYSQANGYATVRVTAYYKNSGLVFNFTYNAEGVIEGLYLNTTNRETATALADTDLYCEKEITVGEFDIKGVVTLPKNTENYPVAVLVQGSGASDYDETVGANKPFRELAHALGEKGIATVRINKRFFQYPESAAETAETLTIYDEYMDDVYSAIEYAKENISDTVFVIGHSQGGMSAPKITQDNNLKGAIMLAGTLRGLEDVIYDQNMQVIETAGYSESEKAELIQQVADGVRQVKDVKKGDKTAPMGLPASYWLSLKELDAENILKTTDFPVLVLQGTADFQVYYDKDFALMQTVLADRKNIEFKAYDGLNHMFMPQSLPGVTGVEEYAAENHIPDYVTDDIAEFILENK
ncbi:MAG: DUF3887 domain-containing protein [Oscillospiraceae bacterium]|nr:DUF3887 domain-containing protein [Oscillospiraceae bacterium]